jgi:glycosyltransferase involved in cell wall biosynthesis
MKSKQPFFSIIIPVYNGGLTIKRCLDSIIYQSFNDMEVLIIDSMSVDNTAKVIEQYQKEFNFITHFIEKDNGVYDGMNKGIAKAKGKYFYFMGSDDSFFSNTVLETVFRQIEKSTTPDIIYGNVLLGDSNLVHNGSYNLCKLFDVNICHQSIFYNQHIFASKLTYDLTYPALADWHLNFRCFTNKSLRIVYANMLVCKFNLGGLSSAAEDSLHKVKKALFLSLARNFFKDEYYKLKRYSTDAGSISGKFKVIYFHSLYCLFYAYRKIHNY